jgi:cytochrome c-type biogenesis protein CcmH
VRRALALLAAAAALATPGAALAAKARTSLSDVEDEVMCPVCGTPLSVSESPQAARERAYIRRLIAQGRTKEQVKSALVEQYGPRVLAVPRSSGFDLAAYLVPGLAILAAATAIGAATLRWRRSRPRAEEALAAPAGAPPPGDDAARLEADLQRYDL